MQIGICMIVGAGVLDGPPLRNDKLARAVGDAGPYG